MPEGDTLFNTALTLRPALLGESLTAVNIRARGMYRLRVGDTVRSVEAVGKFLEIVVERGLALRTHLHMTGVWHLYEQGERWRRPRHLARAVLETESHVAVCFAAPTVEVGPAADDRLAHLGPDLCHADVDLDAVLERVAGSDPSTEIAEVLLDQRLAAGIGNVYKNEVLWACEVSPFRRSPTSTSRCGVGSTKLPPSSSRPTSAAGNARPTPRVLRCTTGPARAATAASVGFARSSTATSDDAPGGAPTVRPEQRSGPVSR